MLLQVKHPKVIYFAIDLRAIDVITVGKNPNLEDDVRIWLLFYSCDEESPATMLDISALKKEEIEDLFDALCRAKSSQYDEKYDTYQSTWSGIDTKEVKKIAGETVTVFEHNSG